MTLNNSGAISGRVDVANAKGATIGALNNMSDGTMNVAGPGAAVRNGGKIASLTNSGAIFFNAVANGVYNAGAITTLENSGAIAGSLYSGVALTNASDAKIGTLDNEGEIDAYIVGVWNQGAIGSITNGGRIGGDVALSGRNAVTSRHKSGQVIDNYNVAPTNGFINEGTIGALTNRGSIGGTNFGISAGGMITKLTNSGTIQGATGAGVGAGGRIDAFVNTGGGSIIGGHSGIYNSGWIGNLINKGAISGGGGGFAGVSNSGAIVTFTNSGHIESQFGGFTGLGVSNSGAITTLTNNGAISGGGSGGVGVNNSGMIGKLTNRGAISGSYFAVDSGGGKLGPIANSGTIVGNVEIDGQDVTITGGGGGTFGRWTEGAITIDAGNLTFAGGNTFLADNISAGGGLGMVTNEGVLQLTGPQSITGSFTQTGAGVLDLGIAGKASGQYGALDISAAVSLDGGLGLDLLNGFSLVVGDKFDVLSFTSLSGGFDALSLDGRACVGRRPACGVVISGSSRGI
jgi:hypothetical protein